MSVITWECTECKKRYNSYATKCPRCGHTIARLFDRKDNK